MVLNILNNLNNISTDTEEVYKDFSSSPPDWYLDLSPEKVTKEPNSKSKKRIKSDFLKSNNTNKNIINLQKSIIKSLKENNKLFDTQQQIIGLMKTQFQTVNQPNLSYDNRPQILSENLLSTLQNTSIPKSKIEPLEIPVKYFIDQKPIFNYDPIVIPISYGKSPTLDIKEDYKIKIPVELGKIPDVDFKKNILPLNFDKIPDIKLPDFKTIKIPLDWNLNKVPNIEINPKISDFKFPNFETKVIPIRYDDLKPINQVINLVSSEPKPINYQSIDLPINYKSNKIDLPDTKVLDIFSKWNIDPIDSKYLKPIQIKSIVDKPKVSPVEIQTIINKTDKIDTRPIDIPVKIGTIPKFGNLTTIEDKEVLLKINKNNILSEISNIKNNLKSDEIGFQSLKYKIEKSNDLNNIIESVKSIPIAIQSPIKIKEILSKEIYDEVKQPEVNKVKIKNDFNDKNIDSQMDRFKNISSAPIKMMPLFDTSQFNRLLEQNSKLVQSVIESTSKMIDKPRTSETMEVNSPIVKVENVKPEESKDKNIKDLHKIMTNVDDKMGAMIDAINKLSTTLMMNHTEHLWFKS
jgi:hypothetical protein